jgi:hypothetical protein
VVSEFITTGLERGRKVPKGAKCLRREIPYGAEFRTTLNPERREIPKSENRRAARAAGTDPSTSLGMTSWDDSSRHPERAKRVEGSAPPAEASTPAHRLEVFAVWHLASSGIPRRLGFRVVWDSALSAVRVLWDFAPLCTSRIQAPIAQSREPIRKRGISRERPRVAPDPDAAPTARGSRARRPGRARGISVRTGEAPVLRGW